MSKISKTIILIIIITAIVLGIDFLVLKKSTDQEPQIISKSVYDEILERGKIRVGYTNNPPNLIVDPNSGEVSGIFPEILAEIGQKLGVEIEYTEEVGWGTMIEAVKAGRVDLVASGIWPTAERAKHVDFSTPLSYSTVKVYVRADDRRFDGDLEKINDASIKIVTIDGEMTSSIAQLDYPNAGQLSLTQTNDLSQLLLNVATKKADVTFAEPAIALEYIANNSGQIKEVENVKPVRAFPNTIMAGKGEVELLSTLNTSIQELINNGLVNKVIEKYEKYPGSYQHLASPFE